MSDVGLRCVLVPLTLVLVSLSLVLLCSGGQVPTRHFCVNVVRSLWGWIGGSLVRRAYAVFENAVCSLIKWHACLAFCR